MYLAAFVVLVVCFLAFHLWALQAYLAHMQQHPEVEQGMVRRALNQVY